MPLILVQLEWSFLFRHPHLSVFNFEFESPDRIEAREGGHCTLRDCQTLFLEWVASGWKHANDQTWSGGATLNVLIHIM